MLTEAPKEVPIKPRNYSVFGTAPWCPKKTKTIIPNHELAFGGGSGDFIGK
jgi:hypothetical protein